jgi:hypothetical protein
MLRLAMTLVPCGPLLSHYVVYPSLEILEPRANALLAR